MVEYIFTLQNYNPFSIFQVYYLLGVAIGRKIFIQLLCPGTLIIYQFSLLNFVKLISISMIIPLLLYFVYPPTDTTYDGSNKRSNEKNETTNN